MTAGATLEPYKSEDNFLVTPRVKYSQVSVSDYNLIVLPGIIDPYKVIGIKDNIDFLATLKEKDRPLISAISASPILLAKAGLLKNVKFTAGLFEETIDEFSFIPKENIVREPIFYDKEHNILTAIGFAQREFAVKTMQLLGYSIPDQAMSGIRKDRPYTKEELTFHMN